MVVHEGPAVLTSVRVSLLLMTRRKIQKNCRNFRLVPSTIRSRFVAFPRKLIFNGKGFLPHSDNMQKLIIFLGLIAVATAFRVS